MNVDGAKCSNGHDIEIVAEGYGVCHNPNGPIPWSPWKFTRPLEGTPGLWFDYDIVGQDGSPIPAWVGGDYYTKEDALEAIQDDINHHRAIPFDEERERARLMPV